MVNLTLSGVAWERASGSAWTQLRWEDHTLWMAHFLTGILDWAEKGNCGVTSCFQLMLL